MSWKYIVIAGLVLSAGSTIGQEIVPKLDQGTHELTVQGFADLEERDDYWYFADIGYGYFVRNGLELGMNIIVEGSDDYDRLSLGPFAEYNFINESQYVPYLGFGMQWINADLEIGSDDRILDTSTDALLLDAEAGMKWFLRNNIALSTALAYEWATDDVFDADNDADDGNALLKVGMRFYL